MGDVWKSRRDPTNRRNFSFRIRHLIFGKMSIVKRDVNDETFGQNLSDVSVIAFQHRIHCDALIVSGDGGEIRAHQVVLAKSPTLKTALKTEVRYQSEAMMIFPEFKKRSLVMMLQFLYTGEVDLISASDLLVEFQELCKVLKLNPQVRKTKYVEGAVISGSDKFSCDGCQAPFDKASKLIFHQNHCSKAPPSEIKVLSTNEVVKTNLVSTNEKKTCPQPEPVINRAEMVQDDFVQEDELMLDTINDQNTVGDVDKNEKYSFAAESSSTGFQMPANFDLPDEIIQEQLPAAKYTSTPIRYAGSGSGEKKMTIKKEAGADLDQVGKLKNRHITSNEAKERSSSSASSSKKEVLKHSTQHVSVKKERVSEKPREQGLLKSKTKSVNEDLAEKRKRLMQKLRNDEDDIIAEKAMKQEKKGKKPFKDKLQPSSTLAGATSSKTQTTSKKAKLDKASRKRRHVSSSSDYSEDESGSYDTSDEEDAASEAKNKMSRPKSKSTTIKRLLQAASEPGSSNKLSVSVQTEGEERIMELWEYKLKTTQIGNTDDDESDSNPEINDKVRTKVVKNKKPLKLEKIGKRIKRIISEDSSEDSSFDFGTKGQLPVKGQLPGKPPISLPVKPPNAHPPCPPSTSPPPLSASREKAIATTSSGPSSPAIAKLPRIPKIQREPKMILPATATLATASHCSAVETSPSMPGPSNKCDFGACEPMPQQPQQRSALTTLPTTPA